MMAFRALLVDAYRQLSAAKLFWITMGMSIVVVLAYGSIGFNDTGMSLFFGLVDIENEFFTAGSPWTRGLYIGIYSGFLVSLWLAWAATVLALISTCTIFPEFISGGAIDLTLSKPIGRWKLFAMKYLVSLLFVVLQVLVFCIGVFLCVGLRIGEWNPAIFVAVPIVSVFYSYLYAVSVLVGMITRSGITALLITGVFWMGLWSAQTAEAVLNQFMTSAQVDLDRFGEAIDRQESIVAELTDKHGENDVRVAQRREQITTWQDDMEDAQELVDDIDDWYVPVSWALTVLPKTGQTIGLLDRWLSSADGFDLAAIMRGEMEEIEDFEPTTRLAREQETQRRMVDEYRGRSLWYVIGTSLLFEMGVLALAGLIFVRRDF